MRFIQFPLCVDCTQESEQYPLLSSELKTVKSADMCIRDAAKILSSILYGPEQSSPISLNTTQALYCIYGPDGVRNQKINAALDLIAQYVSLALPEMKVLWKIVVP
jgi:DNA/RNA-binding domain of Phe-tRNA-synthetase-like protein